MNDATKQNILLASAAVCAVALVGMFANQLVYKAPAAPIAFQQAAQPNVVVQPLVVLPNPESSGTEPTLGGRIHNIQESFDEGIAVDGTEIISGTGALSGAVSLTLGSGGTTIDKHVRTTSAVNVDSLGAGQSTSSAITLTGASSGDHCSVNSTVGDLQGTTSTIVLACRAGSDTATVYYYNATGTSAFNAGASTLSIQAWSY